MANLNIAIQIAAQDQASGPIGRIRNALTGLGTSAQRGFAGLQSVAVVASGAALGGIAALAGGIGAASVAGLGMNKQMEDVSARLNAFTKDADESAAILEMIRQRAAATPFAFNAMADAAAGLLPAASQSGAALEDLVSQAEILAASNPAQGLEGAAFALREAVSGDFTSIIERFNLPRQFINQLKDEGVPNLEIVQRAMQEMGYDADLVANLAQTAGGRWSTFLDTMRNVAATVTQPIFDTFSSGLGRVNEWLSANEPLITGFATTVAETLAGGIERATTFITSFIDELDRGQGPIAALQTALETAFGPDIAGRVMNIVASLQSFVEQVRTTAAPVTDFISRTVSWRDVLIALGVVVASIVLPALYGIVTAAAPVIAVGAALVGAIALARNAWQNDWGGIRTAVVSAWAAIGPQFAEAKAGLIEFRDNLLPPLRLAWQTLGETWRTEISPALSELWASLQLLFAELGFGTGQTSGWDIALGILRVTLGAVLLGVELLTPAIRLAGNTVSFAIGRVNDFVEGLRSMKRAAELIIDPLQRVADRIQELIDRALGMPDWLIPGSPTPFELGLRGISSAAKSMPNLGQALPVAGGGGLAGPARLATTTSVTFEPGSIVIQAPGGDPKTVRQASEDGMLAAFRAVGLR